ncbi:hypothetical protein OpiT1DRAFT_05695 [Opitutaceae bacterium TAV1]|nr:hypothetical protein OpiT1DRAFT_05695 [Opitutaceae bacterium TAV1]
MNIDLFIRVRDLKTNTSRLFHRRAEYAYRIDRGDLVSLYPSGLFVRVSQVSHDCDARTVSVELEDRYFENSGRASRNADDLLANGWEEAKG